jgi:ankyrin repeat protein
MTEVQRILARARHGPPRYRAARERDALIDAIGFNRARLALQLLQAGIDPNATDNAARTALWHAAHWDRADVVRDLVRRGARMPRDVLLGPIIAGDERTVRFLIGRGADVNGRGWHNRIPYTALGAAMVGLGLPHYPPSIPMMLIRAGADVNQYTLSRPLFGYQRSVLAQAAVNGNLPLVRAILKAGARVNFKDTLGGTPLIDAILSGHEKIARVLVAAGARTDVRRRDGVTAFSAAQVNGMTALARGLRAASK